MRKYLVIFALVIGLTVADYGTASAAVECYGYGATTHELATASGARFGQQYTPSYPSDLLSVTLNFAGNPANTGFFHFQIHETTAGVPNSTIVAGSIVQLASNGVPDRAVGIGQKFNCNATPPPFVTRKFTFPSPITLNPGQMYAFTIYQTTTFQDAQIGIVSGDFPGLAPGSGLQCVGGGCATHTGWTLSSHGGFNFDMVYEVVNEIVVSGTGADDKIDSKIQNFREWAKLGDTVGGLAFGVGIVALVFAVGLAKGVPFIIVALLATLLIGAFARAEIVPPWIVLAVVALAGMAMVFRIGGNIGSSSE